MFNRPKWPLLVGFFSGLGFTILTWGVVTHAGWVTHLDQLVVAFVVSLRTPWLTNLLLVLTNLGSPLMVTALGLALAWLLVFLKRSYFAWFAFVTIVLMSLANTSIKSLVQRPRPFVADLSITPLTQAAGFSFPSGHASGAMLLYGCILVMVWLTKSGHWWRATSALLVGVMILGIGFSRVYVQVHFPSDVLAGYCEALTGLMASLWLMWPRLVRLRPKKATAKV